MTDCNFPSDSVASETVSGKFIQLDGLDIPELAKAVLSVLQLDSFLAEPVFRMEVVGSKDELVACHHEMRTILDDTSDRHWEMVQLKAMHFMNVLKTRMPG